MTKTYKDYLAESLGSKKHDFRVKIAGTFTSEQETKMKSMMERFKVDHFKKLAVTPIQQFPLDFPQVKNCEVNIYEVVVDYPTTQQELTEYLSTGLGVSRQNLVVTRPGEPSEQYQQEQPTREGALLNDPDYKEAGNAQFEDYYGDKYNSGFVKELNDILKLQRKERGEELPSESKAKYSSDNPQNNKSPLQQAPETRK